MNTLELGTLVKRSLETQESTGDRLRLVRQFIMDTDRLDPISLAASLADPAPFCGERRWDALIAGVVEDSAYRHGLRVPGWAMESARSTSEQWWFVTSFASLHPTAFVETPASLANRGVFIRRASLVNV